MGIDTGLVYGNMLTCVELGAGTAYQVGKDDAIVTVSSFDELDGGTPGFSWQKDGSPVVDTAKIITGGNDKD